MGDLDGVLDSLRTGSAPRFKRLAQRFADEYLGDQIRRNLEGPKLVDGKNIGMVKRRRSLRLLLEAPQTLRVLGNERRQNFDRDPRFSAESRARYTSPIPPAPSGARIS